MEVSPLTNELNLQILRRYSPYVAQIVAVAPYAVVYGFDKESSSWAKIDVEGPMFICAMADPDNIVETDDESALFAGQEATPTPKARSKKGKAKKNVLREESRAKRWLPQEGDYQVIILNRRGLDNFIQPLLSRDQLEIDKDLIIFHSSKSNPDHLEALREGHSDANPSDKSDIHLFGLWIWDEPPPSAAAGMREKIPRILMERAEVAEQARLRLQGELGGHGAKTPVEQRTADVQSIIEEAAESVPMTSRSISLAQLFEQQRQEDAGFGLQNHHEQSVREERMEQGFEAEGLPVQSISPERYNQHSQPPSNPNLQSTYGSTHIENHLNGHGVPLSQTSNFLNGGPPYQPAPAALPLFQQIPDLQPTPALYPSTQGLPPPPHFIPPTPVNSGYPLPPNHPLMQSINNQRPPPPPQFAANPQQSNNLMNILMSAAAAQGYQS